MQSEAGQAFMSTLFRADGSNCHVNDMQGWPFVKTRMEKVTKRRTSKFRTLALGLAKYDYAGAPSNWDEKQNFDHEKFIVRMADYAMKNKDAYDSQIIDIRVDYRAGRIPDGFSIMCDFCT